MVRRRVVAAVLLVVMPAAFAAAGDDSTSGKKPVPPTLRREGADPLDALLDQLTSSSEDVRHRAEAEVATASADTLRTLVHRLQGRLLTGVPAEETSPSTVAVNQEVRWALVKPADVLSLLNVSSKSADPVLVALTAENEKAWRAAAQAGAIEIVNAPALTTYDGQKGTVEVLDQRSYIGDYDVQTSGGASIADPIISTVQSGSTLGLTAHVQPDRSRIAVAIDADLRRLVDPIAQETIEVLKGEKPLVVQRPEIVGARWQRTITVTPGGAALIVFPAGFYAPTDRRLVLEYRASVVDLPTPAAPPSTKPGRTPHEPTDPPAPKPPK